MQTLCFSNNNWRKTLLRFEQTLLSLAGVEIGVIWREQMTKLAGWCLILNSGSTRLHSKSMRFLAQILRETSLLCDYTGYLRE